MHAYMRKNKRYKDFWDVYINGERVGCIWFKKHDKPIPNEGHTFMHGDFETWVDEGGYSGWETYWGVTIGWDPETLPNRPGRRNGESKARMRYRVLGMMIQELLSWEEA